MSAFNRWCEANKFYRTDGEKGLENLTKISEHLGYGEDNFKWGSPIEKFLADNQGAQEALHIWIEQNFEDYFEDE